MRCPLTVTDYNYVVSMYVTLIKQCDGWDLSTWTVLDITHTNFNASPQLLDSRGVIE
jgi:hypothetical protein